MSTTKKPKRNTRNAARYDAMGKPKIPLGMFERGIKNAEFRAALGELVVIWPGVEDAMLEVFRRLMGRAERDVAEEIFLALQNNNTRAMLMQALLEKTQTNAKLPQKFDELIDRFKRLADQRNKYIHSIWSTHQSSGAIICSPQRKDPMPHIFGQEVTMAELRSFLDECEELIGDAQFV